MSAVWGTSKHVLDCFIPVQKSRSAAATSVVRQFCSWWSDIPPDWRAGRTLWSVGNPPPCSSGRQPNPSPGQQCLPISTSRTWPPLSSCEPSPYSSSRCWRSAASWRLRNRGNKWDRARERAGDSKWELMKANFMIIIINTITSWYKISHIFYLYEIQYLQLLPVCMTF